MPLFDRNEETSSRPSVFKGINIPSSANEKLQIENHFLIGSDIQTQLSPNTSGKFKSGFPDAIIINYSGMVELDAFVNVLTEKNSIGGNASAHIIIGRNGEIIQILPFDFIGWGAGTSQYDGRSGWNNYSIHIELMNVGWLKKTASGNYSRPRLNKEFNESEVVNKKHKNPLIKHEYWEKYTKEQLTTVYELCELLVKNYNIKYILGHEDIFPDRKQDPGPDFPLEEL